MTTPKAPLQRSLSVALTFTQPLLGTTPGNKDIHAEFVASKAPEAALALEESEAMLPRDEAVERASSVFPFDDKGVFLWDYQIKGFLKAATEVLIETDVMPLSKWTYKKAVNLFLYVDPRRIYLLDPKGNFLQKKDVSDLERPLRAETLRGERVALARSEMAPAGTRALVTVRWLVGGPKSKNAVFTEELVGAILDMGQNFGIGQWRSGSWGRFVWERAKS